MIIIMIKSMNENQVLNKQNEFNKKNIQFGFLRCINVKYEKLKRQKKTHFKIESWTINNKI